MVLVWGPRTAHAPSQRSNADQDAPAMDASLVVRGQRCNLAVAVEQGGKHEVGKLLAVVEGEVPEVVERVGAADLSKVDDPSVFAVAVVDVRGVEVAVGEVGPWRVEPRPITGDGAEDRARLGDREE